MICFNMHGCMHTCIHAYMHALMHAFPGPSALRAPTRPPPSQPTKGGTQPPNHPYPQGGSYAWGKGGEGAAQNPGTYNKYMYIYIYLYRLSPTADCLYCPQTARNRTPAAHYSPQQNTSAVPQRGAPGPRRAAVAATIYPASDSNSTRQCA